MTIQNGSNYLTSSNYQSPQLSFYQFNYKTKTQPNTPCWLVAMSSISYYQIQLTQNNAHALRPTIIWMTVTIQNVSNCSILSNDRSTTTVTISIRSQKKYFAHKNLHYRYKWWMGRAAWLSHCPPKFDTFCYQTPIQVSYDFSMVST